MRLRLAPILALLLLGVASCDLVDPCGASADGFADKAESFFTEARDRDYDAGDAAWASYDDRLVELVEQCYPQHETELTRTQDRAFWRGVSGYYVHRYGRAGAKGFLRKLNRGAQEKLREAADAIEDEL